MNDNKKKINLLNRIMVYAAIFAAIVSVLLIFNYLQAKTINPVETPAIQKLVDRLKENPQDDELREQIRALDLLARKAYFTNQWQVRTGGYLVFIAMIVIIIASQIKASLIAKNPETDQKLQTDWQSRLLARKWITIGGLSLFCIALLAAFMSHSNLSDTFSNQQLAGNTDSTNIADKTDNTGNNNETAMQSNEIVADTSVIETDSLSTDTTMQQNQTEEQAPYPTMQELRQNYPSFRGAGSNGIAYQKNIPVSWDGKSGKNVKWKVAIPKQGYNSPVIWGDKVFVAGADKNGSEVYCYDINTGKIIWQKKADNIPGSPAKPPKTTDDTGLSAPTMATDGRRAYAIFGTGDVICFDMEGNRLWAKNLGVPDNHYGHSSSLAVYRNVLIVQYDHNRGSNIYGLSVENGNTIWNTVRGAKISWASPVLVYTGNRMEVILNAEPFVASYNPLSGKELWKIDAVYGEVGPSVAYADGFVYAVNEYARLVGIKLGEKPEIVWEAYDYLSETSSPLATSKIVIVPTSYGIVACHDAKTGDLLWEHEFGSGFYSSPILAEGKVYLMDRGGVMHIFSPSKEFKLIAAPKLGEKSVSTPAFADGKILIRGDKHLFCIEK